MTPIEIPYATGSLRLIMGGACLAFVVLSLVWTVPKIANFIHTRGTRTKGQNVGGSLIWIFIIGFTLVPSTIFAALVKNPTTVIADEGITQENLFSSSADVIGWNEIERVSCTYVRSHPLTYEVSTITVRATDGRTIQMGDSGTRILDPVYDLLQQRLPSGVVQTCSVPFSH